MLLLASIANRFHRLPSEIVGLVDKGVAFAFNVECGTELVRWEQEQEAMRLEVMSAGAIARVLTGGVDKKDGSGPVRLDA